MTTISEHTPLVAIVGPTASGKSDLALELAKEFGGEIICGDSRTVYRGMDIGTAKPSKDEMLQIKHHLVDIKDPGEPFSVPEFKRLAEAKISDIGSRGRLPLLVGGSGLYIDAVLYEFQFPQPADQSLREELEKLTDEQLFALLAEADPEAAGTVDRANRRRVIRAIETAGQPKKRAHRMRSQTLLLGITLNKNDIQKHVQDRAEKMLKKGIIDEVKRIGERYGWESEAMTGIIYRAFKDVVLGTKTAEQGLADFVRGDMALVKKQLTWFRRNNDIAWLDGTDPTKLHDEARRLVVGFLGR